MSYKMKITKRQLKKIIREACGDPAPVIPPKPVSLGKEVTTNFDQPCPYSVAEKLKSAGVSDTEVLEWVNTLLSSFLSSDNHDFSEDTSSLPGSKEFEIGLDDSFHGL